MTTREALGLLELQMSALHSARALARCQSLPKLAEAGHVFLPAYLRMHAHAQNGGQLGEPTLTHAPARAEPAGVSFVTCCRLPPQPTTVLPKHGHQPECMVGHIP